MSEVEKYEPIEPMTIEQFIDEDAKNSVDERYKDAAGKLPRFNPAIVQTMFGYINGELATANIVAFPEPKDVSVHDLLAVIALFDMVSHDASNAKFKTPEAKEFITREALIPLLSVEDEKRINTAYTTIAEAANSRFTMQYPMDLNSVDRNDNVVSKQALTVFGQVGRFVRYCFENDIYDQDDYNKFGPQTRGLSAPKKPVSEPKPAAVREHVPDINDERATPRLRQLPENAPYIQQAVHAYTRMLDLTVGQMKALNEMLNPKSAPTRELYFHRRQVAKIMSARFAGLKTGSTLAGELTPREDRRLEQLMAEEPTTISEILIAERRAGRDPQVAYRETLSGLNKFAVKLRAEHTPVNKKPVE